MRYSHVHEIETQAHESEMTSQWRLSRKLSHCAALFTSMTHQLMKGSYRVAKRNGKRSDSVNLLELTVQSTEALNVMLW